MAVFNMFPTNSGGILPADCPIVLIRDFSGFQTSLSKGDAYDYKRYNHINASYDPETGYFTKPTSAGNTWPSSRAAKTSETIFCVLRRMKTIIGTTTYYLEPGYWYNLKQSAEITSSTGKLKYGLYVNDNTIFAMQTTQPSFVEA